MDQVDGGDQTEALLWSAPVGVLAAPPIDTKAQVLPIGDLHWPDAERLFLRLLHSARPVEYAKLFGTPGQAQAGIDAYARLPVDLTDGDNSGRDYITLQSRRVQSLNATKIKAAVDDFLAGEWAKKTSAFHFATSFDLQVTKLDAAIREQTERLAAVGITFVPWGVQEVSTLLKEHPRIVDDFFGRPWVERFCGLDAAQALANNLPYQDWKVLRKGLRDLYRAVFYAQGGVGLNDTNDSSDQFVILDVNPNPQESTLGEERSEVLDEGQSNDLDRAQGQTYISARYGTRRQSFRSARHLLDGTTRSTMNTVGDIVADEWLAGGRYRLLVGRPGAGKSSLLRFAATDLLASNPQSIALQRDHATDLPIWLPFGFLCRHLEASTENSLVSAVEAWLKSQSATHLWPLVQRALLDDRLLLLIDGVDEWSEVGAAERALGIVEAFLGRTDACAILSTRPYAVDRLNWRLPWAQAEIALLSDKQRRAIATRVLSPASLSEMPPVACSHWSSGVEPFLDQLAATPELAELSRSPLFLTLLATTWQGEPLPRQRFKIYTRLVELLIEKHPQMRQRASHAASGPLTATETSTLFAAVAYRLRLKDSTGAVSKPEMRKLIVESMTDDEVLGYERTAARQITDAVLTMAEDEFGLIVSQGAGAVGFLHRVVLDHMAGQYLATLDDADQIEAVQQRVHDPAWRDVLLTLLTAQVSPRATESLLAAALNSGYQSWEDVDGFELLAEALAAGARLTPRSQTAHMNSLIERVEQHPSTRHRANLITALVGTLASQSAHTRLLPTMKRWLNALRPDPSPTMWAFRDLDIADDVAAEHLLWGIRHPDDNVKANAAAAMAHRFGGEERLVDRLVVLAETGPSSSTQAAAIFALGTGWANLADSVRLIGWARCQPSIPLRLVGLRLLQRPTESGDAMQFRPEELEWLLSLLRHEGTARGPWPAAELVAIAAAGDPRTSDFALETLTTNGSNGGDRSLAWTLACSTFGDDSRFKAWVTAQLAEPEERGLILYNLAMIPQQWREDPAFLRAFHRYLEADSGKPTETVSGVGLATALPADDARTALLRELDAWRPYAAASTLVEEYADDETVRTELVSRLHGAYEQAAPMAGVAIDVLGPKEGFALLASLLRQPDQLDHREERVVVAQATAEAWTRLQGMANNQGAESDAAGETLAAYDPAALAELCTSVNPHHLMWHVPGVITAWPEEPSVQRFADELLNDPKPIMSGIPDTIPVAILRAYCSRNDEPSRRILDKTLNLLRHIEPELREVLAFELARCSLSVNDLLDVLEGWTTEPDAQVRRTAFIGIVQAVARHQQSHESTAGEGSLSAEMAWLREIVRADLCAYGPDYEERRQLAWIGMLMLGDPTLADEQTETLGHSGQVPGVALDVLYGRDVDQILIDLVAESWDQLRLHFGETLYERLNSTSSRQRKSVREQRRYVLSALATVASQYPAIAEVLREEADDDPELRQELFFLQWAKLENRGDEGVLRALVAKIVNPRQPRQDHAVTSLLDRESWNVTDGTFKAILAENMPDAQTAHFHSPAKLAVYAQLFPSDSLSVAALRDLESWFQSDPVTRERRDWDSTLAIAFGVADPLDLPAIVMRAHTRIRMGMSDLFQPVFINPLMRRLRSDPDAVEALKTALGEPMNLREESPIFAGSWDPIADACSETLPLQRRYLFAVVLRQAGLLSPSDGGDIFRGLASASPDTVVHNPFIHHEGPLRLAALDLAVR